MIDGLLDTLPSFLFMYVCVCVLHYMHRRGVDCLN